MANIERTATRIHCKETWDAIRIKRFFDFFFRRN